MRPSSNTFDYLNIMTLYTICTAGMIYSIIPNKTSCFHLCSQLLWSQYGRTALNISLGSLHFARLLSSAFKPELWRDFGYQLSRLKPPRLCFTLLLKGVPIYNSCPFLSIPAGGRLQARAACCLGQTASTVLRISSSLPNIFESLRLLQL
jgi:hypothetical protein